MDLINAWSEIQANLTVFDGNETGYGLTDEQMQQSNDLWVQINEIEAKWDALQDRFAAGFGTITGSLLVNVEGGLDAIADFLNADTPEEREQALADFRANVEDFFTRAAEALQAGMGILGQVGEEFQQSEDPVVQMIGDIMIGIRDALQWMVDHQNEVKGAFETIFGFYLLAKLASVAGKLTSIMAQIETIKAFSNMGGGAVGAGGAAAAGAGGSVATSGLGALKFASLLAIVKVADDVQGEMFRKWSDKEIVMMTPEEIAAAKEQAQQIPEPTAEQQKAAEQFWDHTRNPWQAETFGYGDLMAAYDGANKNLINRLADVIEEMQEQAEQHPESESLENLPEHWWITENESAAAQSNDGPNAAQAPSADQIAAAEALWDFLHLRNNGRTDQEILDSYNAMFAGSENETLASRLDALIDEMRSQAENGDSSAWDMEDLPANWWLLDPGAWQMGGNGGQTGNNISSSDLQAFRGLPAGIQEATRAGAASGVSGIRVTLDGATVGRLVAPYVSESIARDVII